MSSGGAPVDAEVDAVDKTALKCANKLQTRNDE